jgi:hypothetical protein
MVPQTSTHTSTVASLRRYSTLLHDLAYAF